MMSSRTFYKMLFIDLKIDEKDIIIIDPDAEYENMKKQGKLFVETDEANFITPLDCKYYLRGDTNA